MGYKAGIDFVHENLNQKYRGIINKKIQSYSLIFGWGNIDIIIDNLNSNNDKERINYIKDGGDKHLLLSYREDFFDENEILYCILLNNYSNCLYHEKLFQKSIEFTNIAYCLCFSILEEKEKQIHHHNQNEIDLIKKQFFKSIYRIVCCFENLNEIDKVCFICQQAILFCKKYISNSKSSSRTNRDLFKTNTLFFKEIGK